MERMRGFGVFTTLEEMVNPRHTTVIVVDMQNDLCHPAGAMKGRGSPLALINKTIPPLRRLLAAARGRGVTVIYTLAATWPDGTGSSPADQARRRWVWRGAKILPTQYGTWGHKVIETLARKPAEWQLLKTRNDAFCGTNLDALLRSRGIRTVIVTGVATQACVAHTALSAISRDYYTIVPSDCVATTSVALQRAALLVLKTALHEHAVTNSQRILVAWRSRRNRR